MMTSAKVDKDKLFKALVKSYNEAYPDKSKQFRQNAAVETWNSIKKEDNLVDLVNKKVNELKLLTQKKKTNLLAFWSKVPPKDVPLSSEESQLDLKPSTSIKAQSINNSINITPRSSNFRETDIVAPEPKSHAQLKLKEETSVLQGDLHGLYKRKATNFLTTEEANILNLKEKELKEKGKHLKELELAQKRQLKFRQKRKMEMSSLFENNPQLKTKIPSLREKTGRPRLEEDQPDLLNTIIKIAIHGSAAEEKRRSELIRSIKTLDELTEELKKLGYNISRNGVYLRLLPKRSNSSEGKRHIVTAPVRLIRSSNDKHVSHIDGKFCTATIRSLEEIAAVLGPQQVFFLSQDDKARVPIGLSAANKQAPLLMHVEYKVTLPDHDWVVAPQHKLIPSVYAGIAIKENCFDSKNAVSYSGPTFISIRSGKHSSSTALSHATDLQTVLSLPEFEELTKINGGILSKPVFIFTVDGGPDENPRYEKVICTGIHHSIEQNLDALFIATNAPGRSAFNRVERRMAPLSKELAGVILPHASFGTHLDNGGRTIDPELEMKNFQKAGETLEEIWSDVIIDKYPVSAKYIPPHESEILASDLCQRDLNWRQMHVRESQYFTQIVKCFDEKCCSSSRGDYFKIVPERFLPPPLPLLQAANGLTCPDFPVLDTENQKYSFPSVFLNLSMNKHKAVLPKSAKLFKTVPYDLYCPSVQSQLQRRICKRCSLYHSSITRMQSHSKIVCQPAEQKEDTTAAVKVRPLRVAARRQRELLIKLIENGDLEWVDENEIDGIRDASNTKVPCEAPILTIEDHLASPWENE